MYNAMVSPKLSTAEKLSSLFDELFPLMRSITGPGLEQSFNVLRRHMPLIVEHVPSGTTVFDWIVPQEWHVRSGRLTAPDGRVVADLDNSTLEIVNYSRSIDARLSLEELQPHLHSLPDLPHAVPYVTSYYNRIWGFCLSHAERQQLQPGTYHAFIDASFVDGGLPFGQTVLPGESPDEILLTSYLCHPSLANNELSGPLVLLALYERLKAWPRRRFTYRFLINPETIGSLCFLSRYAETVGPRLLGGLVLTCVGGPSPSLSYKLSRRGDGPIDQVMRALADGTVAPVGLPVSLRPFTPTSGSDERQYCSPGFNWPMGQLARTTYGTYDGYHNSLDDKAFMGIDRLVETVAAVEEILKLTEIAGAYRNLSPFGEPQLGRRNLYPNLNSAHTWRSSADCVRDNRLMLNRILTILSYSDGTVPMRTIAEHCGCDLRDLEEIIEILERENLVAVASRTEKP